MAGDSDRAIDEAPSKINARMLNACTLNVRTAKIDAPRHAESRHAAYMTDHNNAGLMGRRGFRTGIHLCV
jgi:hypothetical protein